MNYIRMRLGAIVVGALLVLTACGVSTSTSRDDGGTALTNDPRKGPVFVRLINVDGYPMNTLKFCDGTTLVYNFIGGSRGGGAIFPNSPECAS